MVVPEIHLIFDLIFDLILFNFRFNFHIGTTPGISSPHHPSGVSALLGTDLSECCLIALNEIADVYFVIVRAWLVRRRHETHATRYIRHDRAITLRLAAFAAR